MRGMNALLFAVLACFLASCAQQARRDDDTLLREALEGIGQPVPAPLATQETEIGNPETTAQDDTAISTGTGQFVRPTMMESPRPKIGGANAVNFNFENQPIAAAIQAILGDLLKKRFVIAPGVQGNVTFSTAEPVDRSQSLPILETLLSWTGNAMIQKEGYYLILPAKDAMVGNLVPRLGAPSPQGGLQARMYPLHFISATEMQKVLIPFARPEAILQADNNRNLLILAGTPEELRNYQRAIAAFDVNWLHGMSVAVFNLQRTSVGELLPELEKLFGSKADTPLAGMIRFIPMEQSNTLLAISAQPAYLEDVRGWVERIDRGDGNQPQLFIYEARNIEAADLAGYLSDIYGSGEGDHHRDRGGHVRPGLTARTLDGGDEGAGLGSTLGGGRAASDNASASYRGGGVSVLDNGVRITTAGTGNQLLVRALPAQWAQIQAAIKRLDVAPLQVQVEMRVLEVSLSGEFRFGVQWYLEGLIGGNGGVGQPGNRQQVALGSGGTRYNATQDRLFYSFVNHNLQVALHAMEASGRTKVLSAPSVVVANKQAAHIQVGSRIPITQNFIDTDGSANATVGTVQYQDTGVILDVTPRVNPGGLVYLDVSQQVSSVDTAASVNAAGNPTILQRQVNTHAIVQSGQTVLLGGLIQQDESRGDGGVPFLNRIPVLGRLFGTTNRSHSRTELIVLITPTVIASGEDARRVTEEYRRKLRSFGPWKKDTPSPP